MSVDFLCFEQFEMSNVHPFDSQCTHLSLFSSYSAIECKNGTYGYNCVNSCSGHCLNDFACNKQTGHCDGGCDPGYTNSGCNKGKITDDCIYAVSVLSVL